MIVYVVLWNPDFDTNEIIGVASTLDLAWKAIDLDIANFKYHARREYSVEDHILDGGLISPSDEVQSTP